MKITKLTHSCLLVEMPDRTALFDPGVFSSGMVNIDSLVYLDDIIITHEHADHMDMDTIKALAEKFPDVRITVPAGAAAQLKERGLKVSENTDGLVRFEAPHERVEPMFQTPDNIGVHYLGMLTDPGDSLHFAETKPILALPITAPWGATVDAVNLALELKPRYVIPVHDWHWRDEAREQMYDGIQKVFAESGIEFIKPKDGESFNIKL